MLRMIGAVITLTFWGAVTIGVVAGALCRYPHAGSTGGRSADIRTNRKDSTWD